MKNQAFILPPNEIKKIRNKLKISQSELAEKVGVQTTTVGRWEVGERECKGEYAEKIKQLDPSFNKKIYNLNGKVTIEFSMKNFKAEVEENEEIIKSKQSQNIQKGIIFIGVNNININTKIE